MAHDEQPEIAIVGGGIAGLGLAIGLLSRGIKPTIYERTPVLREIGAAIGFSKAGEWAMGVLDPRLPQLFKSIMTVTKGASMTWVDGQTDKTTWVRPPQCKVVNTCHRVPLVDGMAKLIPPEVFRYNKKLVSIVDDPANAKVQLKFSDGTIATADIVIGCDGVKSAVKRLLFGDASAATYSGKYAFRALLPLDKAKAIMGDGKATNQVIHIGPDSHIFSCNIGDRYLNIVAYRTDLAPWPDPEKVTATTTKADAMAGFETFPTIRKIIEMLPDELERWGIFDTVEKPPRSYTKGRVCIAGDAAHAMGPYMGTGAGLAIEDAAVLATLIGKVVKDSKSVSRNNDQSVLLRAALQAYNDTRMPRTRWVAANARLVGEMLEWQNPEVGKDYEKMAHEVEWRVDTNWNFDVGAMLAEAEQHYLMKSRAMLPSARL
ncbi:FAD-dependent monooxygenase orf3 [Pseudocercospora fuligena]|uniref:FAD-dependent monooxygenase orf3 n=1 Tax=Pseudocercospora fuligena TaxID=685502 RepID=A0A8H6RL97_9PEZI|nr:FAD-dependent monooxygenase orf3 [Pseudocercospora fuligena]